MTIHLLDKIHWLGHASFRVDADKRIYIDPYELPADSPKADVILITHEHYDHFSPKDVSAILTPETDIVSIAAVTQKLVGNLHTVKPGDRITVRGLEIEAVAAYNVGKDFHPRSSGGVGFIVTVDGQRLYHSGDTDLIPEMYDVRADVALLPVGGKYTMNATEAAQAADRIKPQVAIPMHYGTVVGEKSDAELFAEKTSVETRILQPEREG